MAKKVKNTINVSKNLKEANKIFKNLQEENPVDIVLAAEVIKGVVNDLNTMITQLSEKYKKHTISDIESIIGPDAKVILNGNKAITFKESEKKICKIDEDSILALGSAVYNKYIDPRPRLSKSEIEKDVLDGTADPLVVASVTISSMTELTWTARAIKQPAVTPATATATTIVSNEKKGDE